MCGMAGFISGNTIPNDLTILRNLLLLNTFRGEDSTGMFDCVPGGKPLVKFWKSDMHPNYFLTEQFYTTWEQRWKKDKPMFAAIHCRAATQGKISKTNAHPFKCGNILGMHNGTIGKTFLNRDKFDTDSEAIFHNIDTLGLKPALKAIQDADPAFALVWYDLKNKTLNFIRNSKRTLAYTKSYGDTIYWSSDPKHLEMGVAAASYTKATPVTTLFTIGRLYTIDITKKEPVFTTEDIEEAEEPVTSYFSSGYSPFDPSKTSVDHWESCGKTSAEVQGKQWGAYKSYDKKSKKWYTDYQYGELLKAREREKKALVTVPNNVVEMTFNNKNNSYEKKEEPLNDDLPFELSSGASGTAKEYAVGPGFKSMATEAAYKAKIKRGCACCGSGVTVHDQIFWLDMHDFLCLDCAEELVFAKETHWLKQYNLCSEAQQLSLATDYNDVMYPSNAVMR